MNWLRHFLINVLFISVYFFISGNTSIKIFFVMLVTGIFIDFDHIINDIASGRIKQPRKMIKRWFEISDKHTGEFHFLHNIEVLVFLLIFSFYNSIFFYMSLAFTVHIASDYYIKVKQTKSLSIEDFSVILRFLNRKEHKNKVL